MASAKYDTSKVLCLLILSSQYYAHCQIRNSGIHIDIELSELNLYPIYEDVNYDGVNDVILNASPGTYAFRLKQPLLEIANQFCSCSPDLRNSSSYSQSIGHSMSIILFKQKKV
ncbi:uncharacterized protein DC041_0003350 [Schistosoma bovis]|uniref:Uncharacterized protein n=1 Tax=Schistosoma bovis TaxID=6184 RepID=A0A430QE31_SCHBO|nr:uncharacterized protein DC041_0003350 [Schistosoma bovis]